MRKFFSFFAALLFAGSMMATVESVDFSAQGYENQQAIEAYTGTNFTVAFDKGGSQNGPKYYTSGTAIRCYAGNKMTFASKTAEEIIQLVITFGASDGTNAITANVGTFETATWTGSASSVELTIGGTSGNRRIKAVEVTFGAAPAVATPVITGDAVFFDSTIVTITCSTQDADIYYTTDGTTDPKCDCAAAPEYKKPLVLKATTTIKAAAYTGNDWSAVAEKVFTKAPEFASFEALIAAQLASNTLVKVSFENIKIDSIYTSSQSKKQGIYFTVGEKAYEIYYNKAEVPETWVAGGTVSGTICGNWTEYNGIWEIVPSANDWAWALTYKAPAAPVADNVIFEWTKGDGAKIEADQTDLNANNMGTMTAGTFVKARLLGANAIDNNAKGYKLGNNDVCVEIQGTSAFAVGDTVIITGVCGGDGARAFAIAPNTTVNAAADTALTNTQENKTDILEYKVVVKEAQAGDTMRVFRQAGKTMYLYSIKVVRPEAQPVTHTYTIAGSPATLFGTAWDPANAANDMKPITGSEYLYAWEKDSVALTAGDIEFKVVEDHAWTKAWPAQNYKLNIAEAGLYKVSIFFNPEFADSIAVYATAEKKGDAKVLPNIILHGNFTGNWADTEAFTPAADSATASLTLALYAGTFEFGFKFDGTWKANGANLTREANTANLSTGSGNMHITADVPGNYVFTYTYETEGLVVTYPEPIIVPDTVKIVVKEDLEWTDAVAAEGWWQIMGENEGYVFSLSNVSTTEVPGTYTVADLDYDYSYVKPKNGTSTIHFVSGQVEVAVVEEVVMIAGALIGDDNKVYAFDLVYDPAAVNPYKYDEKDADFVYDFESYELDAKYVSQGVMMISAQTDTTSLGLIVYLPQGQTTLVAGEYPVAATPAYQTVVAGYYDAEYAFSGSMAATLIEQGGELYYKEIWYLVSGKATVDANLNITVDALNSNSKLIKSTMKAKAQGVEDVKAAVKATKSLQNGILVIEKNGVKYNVTGLQIR